MPFHVTSSEILHTNPWFRLHHDTLVLPDGTPGNYYYSEFRPVVIIIAVENDQILTVNMHRHTVQLQSIEFAAGVSDEGEAPETAARRELAEETGYTAEKMTEIGSSYGLIDAAIHLTHVYLAEGLHPGPQRLDAGEQDLVAKWVPITEWKEKIRNGEVIDGETLAAWGLYREWKDAQDRQTHDS